MAGFKSLQLLLYLLNQWSIFARFLLDFSFKQHLIFVVLVRERIQTQPLYNFLCNALPLEPPPSERIRMFRKVSVFRYSEPFPRSVSWFGLITESHFHINEKIVILIKFFFFHHSSTFSSSEEMRKTRTLLEDLTVPCSKGYLDGFYSALHTSLLPSATPFLKVKKLVRHCRKAYIICWLLTIDFLSCTKDLHGCRTS